MRNPKDVKKGDFFRRFGGNFKVLGIVEGYAVLRRKGAGPVIESLTMLLNGKHGWVDLSDLEAIEIAAAPKLAGEE